MQLMVLKQTRICETQITLGGILNLSPGELFAVSSKLIFPPIMDEF